MHCIGLATAMPVCQWRELRPKLWICTLTLLVGFILSCKEEPGSDLPPATQTGSHTMGYYIDGQRWTPLSSDFKSGNSVARYLSANKTLFIGGNDNLSQCMGIAVMVMISVSKYLRTQLTSKLTTMKGLS